MDKITEALKKILPEDQISEVSKAVEDMMAGHYKSIETEFNTKLEEAYEQLSEERKQDTLVAEQGYQQAYEIVASLMQRTADPEFAHRAWLPILSGFAPYVGKISRRLA